MLAGFFVVPAETFLHDAEATVAIVAAAIGAVISTPLGKMTFNRPF
jgi:hypothetical protein